VDDSKGFLLPGGLNHPCRTSEYQGPCGAFEYAGGPQPLVDPGPTPVAFGNLSRVGIQFRDAEGTGHRAGLTTDAQFGVRIYDTVGSFLHGTCRTGLHTSRSIAMQADLGLKPHDLPACTWHRTDLKHFDRTGTGRQIVFHFTGHFATVASDATVGIDHQCITVYWLIAGLVIHQRIAFKMRWASSGDWPLL
jgi:hypothetical protein